MSVDIANAFNTCDRALLLEKVWATPELAEMFPIVSLAYSSPSKLLIRQGAGPTLWSSNGVRQGDPLSSLLFCLYQREAYEAVAAAAPSVTLYAYMDNLYIVGPPPEVTAAFSSLKLQLQSLRLECNKGKSFYMYFHDEDNHPLSQAVEQYLEHEGIEIKREYAEVLGAVIGANEQAIIDGLMSISPPESMDHFFRRLRNPNLSAQAAMMILSRCGVPKLNYRLRCTPPPCMAAHATAMDETVLTTTAALLDLIKQQGQQPEVVAQLQAPLRCGGYGLTSAAQASPIAYYSSVVSCLSMPHISQAAQSWSSTASASAPSSAQPCMLQQHLDQCLTTIRANITGNDGKLLRTDLVPSSASEIIPHYQQHQKVKPFVQQEVTTIIHKRQLQAAIAKAEVEEDETTLARLLGVTAPGASVWLTTAPTTPAVKNQVG